MKDFTIESILADTCMFEQTDTRFDKFDNCDSIENERDRESFEKNSKINAAERLVIGTKNRLESETNSRKCFNEIIEEEWLVNNSRNTHEFSETENCDVTLEKNSEAKEEKSTGKNCTKSSKEFQIKRFRANFKECGKFEACRNSLCSAEESKSNFLILRRKEDTKNYIEEFREINKKNYGKNSEIKEDSVRYSKRDQRRKFDKDQKRQSKKNQNNSKNRSSNKNCHNELPKCEDKSVKNNLNRKSDEVESKYPPSDNLLEFSKDKTEKLELQSVKQLEWLQFTRYKPPKIPRKPTMGKNKRKPSLHPRIPFSTFQIDFLEQKFRNSAYLSRNDVLDISVNLKLPPNRVKIWFQNRRARERREFHANVQ